MQVELLALTQRNPALTQSKLAGLGDLPTLFDGKSTYGEAIMEFAGRVCYRSTHRMGSAPDFIAARVPGTLAEVEEAAHAADQGTSLEATAEALRAATGHRAAGRAPVASAPSPLVPRGDLGGAVRATDVHRDPE